jgi:hypothetical protein
MNPTYQEYQYISLHRDAILDEDVLLKLTDHILALCQEKKKVSCVAPDLASCIIADPEGILGAQILLQCESGKGYSVLIAVVVLMRKYHFCFDDGLQYVR